MGAEFPPRSDLTRLEARPHQLTASHSRTVLICDRDGMITDPARHGVFIHETRMLSHYGWRLNRDLYCAEASAVRQNSVLVYAITRPRRLERGYSGAVHGHGGARDATEETIELRLATVLSDGLHQDADITNYTIHPQTVTAALEFDCDFAGLDEVIAGRRQQHGRRERRIEASSGGLAVGWRYTAHHRGRQLERSARLSFTGLPHGARCDGRRLRFTLRLAPGATAHLCIELSAQIEQQELKPFLGCNSLNQADERQLDYLRTTALISQPPQPQTTVERAVLRARHDLAALRMNDLDRGGLVDGGGNGSASAWVPAAGIPNYVATFGRDILTAAWQSALLGPEIMRGSLRLLSEIQGTRNDPWRDEEPGKMLHEAHTGPLAVLDYKPQGRYYGSFNTSPFYVIVLSEYLHWTGDRAGTLAHMDAAQRAMQWMERYGHPGHKHFYAFQTRSSQGVKNQGWKDSGDALIYPDGRIVPDPIATCEIQGYAYEAKLRMVELNWLAGERAAAARMLWQAHELKKRFNDAYWMEDEQYFAMALDPHRCPVRSVGSDPGDALATGILAPERVAPTVERLFAPDMFSGWGIRTLSSRHLAYNPYSYHRGSVWPAENAAIGVGLRRYGYTGRLAQLLQAQMEIAERFQFVRLPEVIGGHGKSDAQPFPPVYPKSCSPQAWSAGAPVIFLQMLLGIYPYAPLHTLFLDPQLPEWLPEVTVERLRVGEAICDIHFRRQPDGTTDYEIKRLEGRLHAVRQPSPWSVFASPSERVEDFIGSLRAA
ncbi:MAG: amylo-alpha-1,6-glucosidase [Terriglobales bacterium]